MAFFGNDSVLDKYQIVPALSGRIYPVLINYLQKSVLLTQYRNITETVPRISTA